MDKGTGYREIMKRRIRIGIMMMGRSGEITDLEKNRFKLFVPQVSEVKWLETSN